MKEYRAQVTIFEHVILMIVMLILKKHVFDHQLARVEDRQNKKGEREEREKMRDSTNPPFPRRS